ncbi:MAG: SAM-dependent DNA methyltransferase, partial [Spirochaetia bacterium]
SEEKTPAEKAKGLKTKQVVMVGQREQRSSPDCRIGVEESQSDYSKLLMHYCRIYQGSSTGDDSKFVRYFWEVLNAEKWKNFLTTRDEHLFSGRRHVWDWENENCELSKYPGARIQGFESIGKHGFAVAGSKSISFSLYFGECYNKALATVILDNISDNSALWAFFQSGEFSRELRKLDKKLLITPGTFGKVPFDLEYWQKVAAEKYPDGLPKPHSDDPTQWLFSGHPTGSDAPLQVAVARMLGYRWPRLTGSSFPDCPALGPDGLEKHADADGVVCVSMIQGVLSAVDRLRALLADVYGAEWGQEKQKELLASVGFEGRQLADWLRDGFFEQHCRLFQQRPFIWHVWDGNRSGFSALLNYHTLTRATLEKLIYTYLGDWINRQRRAVDSGEEGSDARLEAALGLKSKLEAILEGEPPYDIFVRWKPLSKQAMGWAPDLNDGVRLNIRPFILAGILRKNPKVNWGKDKGKEPQRERAEYPWFWAWDGESKDWPGGRQFTGERFNDFHYSKSVKQKHLQA